MRNTIFAVSCVSLLLSAAALGAPVEDAKPAVMPSTPSGVGDQDTVVCRAPQAIAGSGQLGPQVCLHNSEWWKVAMNGKDVAPDGKSLIAKATVDNPTGEGDPDAVTCRTGKKMAASARRHLPVAWNDGREICQTNRFWADVRRGPVDYGSPYKADSGGIDAGRIQSGMPLPSEPGHPH